MGAVTDGLTSIVIVAADSGPLMREAVAAALASTARVEVIIVDNASVDGEPGRIAADYADDGRVRILSNGRNLGFGVACNRGAAVARGDALLFLNPDCLIEPNVVASLRAAVASDPALGLLSIGVRSPDGKRARGNRRRDPTLRRVATTISGLARFESRWPALAGIELPAARTLPAALERVDAVSGACLFLPRGVFDSLGGFDEGYFLHVEDLDLCRRVRDAGRVVALADALHAVHAQGGSSRHRPVFVGWHKHRGMWRYFMKFDPAARIWPVRALVFVGLWIHFALAAPAGLLRRRSSRAAATRPHGTKRAT